MEDWPSGTPVFNGGGEELAKERSPGRNDPRQGHELGVGRDGKQGGQQGGGRAVVEARPDRSGPEQRYGGWRAVCGDTPVVTLASLVPRKW